MTTRRSAIQLLADPIRSTENKTNCTTSGDSSGKRYGTAHRNWCGDRPEAVRPDKSEVGNA